MPHPSSTPLRDPSAGSNPGATPGSERKILFSSNSAWNLANFRKPVIEALVAAGYEVVAAAPADGSEAALEAIGARFRPLEMRGAGMSPLEDLRLLLDYIRVMRDERPALFVGFTAKPNIYGCLAARLLGVESIATISGLGSAFLRGGLLGATLLALYRLALGGARAVMFQNHADRDLFLARRIVRQGQARMVAGSGIDLDRFAPAPMPDATDGFRFLLIARLLKDKGIEEYVEAARSVGRRHPGTRFQLLGPPGGDNPSAVPDREVERWATEGIVEYCGVSEDVRPFIAAASCVVLPSYREGLPRSLLEGAAMARPLIASDVPGCRELVEHGVTGLLCDARSAGALAEAMEAMLALSSRQRAAMGKAGRGKAETEYDQRLVADVYLAEVAR